MKRFLPGQMVRVSGMNGVFEITEGPNKKDNYHVVRGAIRIWVSVDAISPVPEQGKKKHPKGKKLPTKFTRSQASKSRELVLDLHGCNRDEAELKLVDLLNKALLEDVDSLRIIHGIGSGTIKIVVHSFLSTSAHVRSFRVEECNAGVTLAYL